MVWNKAFPKMCANALHKGGFRESYRFCSGPLEPASCFFTQTTMSFVDWIPSAANLFTTVPLLLMLFGTILNVAGLVFAFVGFCFNTNCNNLFESGCLPCCDCCSCAAESIICTAGGKGNVMLP